MVNELLTLNFKKFKRSKNNRTCILCCTCKVHFRIFFWGRKCYHICFTKKLEKGEREERDEGERKEDKTRREGEREEQVYSNFHKSNLSKSISFSTLAEPRHHLHDTKFQIRAVLLIIVQCTHMFWTKCKTSVSLKNRNISHSTVWRTLKLQIFKLLSRGLIFLI